MDVTRDPIARGKLVIHQPSRGYRFNIDSVILAGFASPPGTKVCDLGTGSGIVGLWLASEGAGRVVGVELQPELAELARINALQNGLQNRYSVVEGDLRAFELEGEEPAFDQVVANPPFAPLGRGRTDANAQRAIARHEIHMRLEDLFAAGRRLLAPGGRIDLVHRADREDELFVEARSAGLLPARVRRVSTRRGDEPSRVLFEARRTLGEAEQVDPLEEPPLVLHEEDGRYSPEVARLLGDPAL